jgi:DNA polymerase-3 subunit gamma/tau
VDAAAVRRLWSEILERVKKRRVVWSLMQNATPRAVEGNELVLAVQHQGLVRRFADDQVVKLLQEALHEVLGVRWTIRAVADGGDPPPTGTRQGDTRNNESRHNQNETHHNDPRSGPGSDQANRADATRRADQPATSGDEEWPEVRPVLRSVPSGPDVEARAGSVRPGPAPQNDHEGFDPGDEPLDEPPPDDDATAPRRDAEAEALALLQQTLGARKIGELNHG